MIATERNGLYYELIHFLAHILHCVQTQRPVQDYSLYGMGGIDKSTDNESDR